MFIGAQFQLIGLLASHYQIAANGQLHIYLMWMAAYSAECNWNWGFKQSKYLPSVDVQLQTHIKWVALYKYCGNEAECA